MEIEESLELRPSTNKKLNSVRVYSTNENYKENIDDNCRLPANCPYTILF